MTYPAYFKSIRTDAVVKFTGKCQGTVIVSGGSLHDAGETHDNFIPHDSIYWELLEDYDEN